MIILIPFFGDTVRFRPLLDKWIAAYVDAKCPVPWFALTDGPEDYSMPTARMDISGFRNLVREGQPFDVKGALVCAALLTLPEPILVLDADALIVGSLAPALEAFGRTSIAMPIDSGALVYYRRAKLDAPLNDVRKMCAGVMFFGDCAGRSRLVAGYRRAYEEMRESLPWTPKLPHLLEQYAWSVAHHRRGGMVLPQSFNWNSRHLGSNPFAFIEHDYGHLKWNGEKRPVNC